VQDLLAAAELFGLEHLATICRNVMDDSEFLNPSIGTWLNDEAGAVAKQLFLNRPLFSDVAFEVEGKRIHAHKAILMGRCKVLAAMFSGLFVEDSLEVHRTRARTHHAHKVTPVALFANTRSDDPYRRHVAGELPGLPGIPLHGPLAHLRERRLRRHSHPRQPLRYLAVA
jgi:hypothetical protein